MNTRYLGRALVLSLVVGSAGFPSRASAVGVTDVISGIKTAYDVYSKYQGNQLTLAQATSQMIYAINTAKTEILARIDGIAAADAKACSKAAITTFGDIQYLSWDSKQHLATDSLECLLVIEAYLEVVEDKAAVDKLGFALNALGPVVMMARVHAGLPRSHVVSDAVLNGNYAVIAKLFPRCVTYTLWGDSSGGVVEQNIKCTAYNGDYGWAWSWVGDPAQGQKKIAAQNTATRNTSRAVAQAVRSVVPSPG